MFRRRRRCVKLRPSIQGRRIGMLNILAVFQDVEDPRRSNLVEMLAIALLSMPSGGRTCVDMSDYAHVAEPFLRRFMKLRHSAPSYDAFGPVQRAGPGGPGHGAAARGAGLGGRLGRRRSGGRQGAAPDVRGRVGALASLDHVWTWDSLVRFLVDPGTFAPGTSMFAVEVTEAEARVIVNFIDYRGSILTKTLGGKSGDYRRIIDADFDVYLRGRKLVYVKAPCDRGRGVQRNDGTAGIPGQDYPNRPIRQGRRRQISSVLGGKLQPRASK